MSKSKSNLHFHSLPPLPCDDDGALNGPILQHGELVKVELKIKNRGQMETIKFLFHTRKRLHLIPALRDFALPSSSFPEILQPSINSFSRLVSTRCKDKCVGVLESKMSTGPGLESLVDQTISVITNDGRNIVGILKGFDQATNIILDESHERVYSTKEGVQQLVLGLYIIRGDNIGVVGELDEDLDSSLDLSKLRAHPLKPVIH
ncbi:hypothetical protein RJT34_17525 [Clitoria ternatea]|uniref:U6 snRNA-associated Sm-like protein LSm8 n=1 Tax=Clitoria ternatea TaxID=43366 RepID=A0AAN9PD80_CLITE